MAEMQSQFIGTNNRSLAQFLNEKNSDIEFVENTKSGKIFAVLPGTGENITVSASAQEEMRAKGVGSLADYQVVDMPGRDQQTGMPNGTIFALITRRSQANVIGKILR